MSDVTQIICAIEQGDPRAAAELLPLVYDELRKLAAAAEAMRRILVEAARRKQTEKHGGGRVRVDLPEVAAPDAPFDDLVALDDALTALGRHDPDAARLVTLRYFAGLSHQDAADALGISRGAADRLWALGRAWLYRQLSK